MKKLFIILFISIAFISSCSRGPGEIKFAEIKGYKNYISEKDFNKIVTKAYTNEKYTDKMFIKIKNSSSLCKVLCFQAEFKKPIGVTEAKLQLTDFILGRIIADESMNVNPEMEGLMYYYQFPKKGKFTMLIIANEIVIAKGTIEIK